jgi:hypothetical protein
MGVILPGKSIKIMSDVCGSRHRHMGGSVGKVHRERVRLYSRA